MNAAIDAVIALLLISAAVGVVVTADTPGAEPEADPAGGDADAVADALAATTATVNYSLAPGTQEVDRPGREARGERQDRGSPELRRTTHGSLAGLLARATVASSGVAVDGSEPSERGSLTRTRAGFRRAVTDAVRARTGAGVRVDAVWRPYPGAPVGGRVGVGPEPPGEEVHAATLTIPTGVDPIPPEATVTFGMLGRAVAARTVEVLVPHEAARITLRGDDPEAALVAHRYARLANATNTSVAEPLATEDTAAANARVTEALAARMTGELRSRYDRPSRAANAVSVSSVRIVVRTWGGPSGGG